VFFVSLWFNSLPLWHLSAHAAPAKPEVEKITENVYRVGQVVLDMKARSVVAQGRVNMRKGIIEYLAVAPEGKRHESVLILDADPLHLQVALLLLGLEPGGGLSLQGDTSAPRGPGLVARVRWRAEGRERETRLEEFAWDIPRRRPMEAISWIFSGLNSPEPRLAAAEGSLIASYRDPKAVLNNPLPTGADDTVYKANERLVPPVGTSVTVTLRPAEKAALGAGRWALGSWFPTPSDRWRSRGPRCATNSIAAKPHHPPSAQRPAPSAGAKRP
jgi:hypothetical protein